MPEASHDSVLKVGLAQIVPVWLDKASTLEKVGQYVLEAAQKSCGLVIFGEGLVPGYPFWVSLTDASTFNDATQKEIHAHYMANAVQIEQGDLDNICHLAKTHSIAIYLGIIERPADRGNHSLYCSLVFIDQKGTIQSVHRKLQPTYEERLTWAQGDGHGLRTHPIGPFMAGGLNCWENWMPLARASLYAQGENLHIAVWPGTDRNTQDITRFIAQESRSFVISVSGLMRKADFPPDTPHLEEIVANCPDLLANGGSCIAGPDGEWIIPPFTGQEQLLTAELNIEKVFKERQNFDSSGHYSRPDVTKLTVNRQRQSIIEMED